MRIHIHSAILLAISVTSVGLEASMAQEPGSVRIEKRSLTLKPGEEIEFDFGTLFVRENRSDPKSRTIGVGFARFPTTSKAPAAPPVFRLPGGPGYSQLTRMRSMNAGMRKQFSEELARLRAFCDVVIVDQRGHSEQGDVLLANYAAKKFRPDEPLTVDKRVSMFKAFAEETVAKFKDSEVDLRGYTVKECADDVAELRQALGYDKITLNGTSFGSQWSFAIMRRRPEIVARGLLSGVEPLNSGYDMPSYVFAAVQRMWRTIDADERFAPYLPEGGMAEAARVVIERLEREPLKIETPASSDGGKKQVVGVLGPDDFPWNQPTLILELYHGRTDRFRRMTVMRLLSGQRQSIRLIGPLIDSSLGVTPERRHRLWTDPATRYLGRGNFALYLETADIWPSPDVGDELRTPVLSDIPVVFAQGTWDTQTPLENTFEIAPFFTNSRVLIAERGGHGVLGSIDRELPKVSAELLEFLRTGDMQGIPARVKLRPSRTFRPPSFPPEE